MGSPRATATAPEPAPGAPSPGADDGVRARLLDHTLRVLLRDGYRGFSMNAVAASARASKETLYRHFGDKAGLLRAALGGSAALIGPLLHDGLDDATTPSERLRRLGLNYLRARYLPEALALQRIAFADGEHGLGPAFAVEITDRAVAYVEEEFAALGSDLPRDDAETFLGMIQGKLHERIMLGAPIPDLDEHLEHQVDHALRMLARYLDDLDDRPSSAP